MSGEVAAGIRRLPVYIVVDCSGSMVGDPIAALETGLRSLLSELRVDPQCLETVWLSVITFDSTAEQIVPLTDVQECEVPDLKASGSTALGEAIELLTECLAEEVHHTT